MNYQVTGNEYLSLPTIRENDGAVEGVTFLYMQVKGLLEIRGEEGLIRPYVEKDGKPLALHPVWSRMHCWIPSFVSEEEQLRFSCTYLTPVGERGLILRLTLRNNDANAAAVRFGTRGDWDKTLHEINETTQLTVGREVFTSSWNHMFIFAQKPALPLFAFSPCVADPQPFAEIDQQARWTQAGYTYDIFREVTLQPGEEAVLDIPWGVGYESVAAATSAKELLRQGFDEVYARTAAWLAAHEKPLADPILSKLLNTNLFFAFFYASGRTIDTEELCLMTSRSPRYYVSAAYWDRDSLLWAFPAILTVDAAYAREILTYAFTRQARHFGVHSRYIDGTMLEPGFELDELCAPVIALNRYVEQTGDMAFAKQPFVHDILQNILHKLEEKKHPTISLYETFLQPTDDMHNFVYLTYDNALVCCTFFALAKLMDRPDLMEAAERTRQAVYTHCVKGKNGQAFFAWSVDLNGHHDIYDEPPGSLQLLPFYGFCAQSDPIWKNTVSMIRDKSYPLSFAGHSIAEIGCKHAPHPWVLSICNSLLSGHTESALRHLRRTAMDNGVACESVNEDTGLCETGEAFATCAGFLSYALYHTCYQSPYQPSNK